MFKTKADYNRHHELLVSFVQEREALAKRHYQSTLKSINQTTKDFSNMLLSQTLALHKLCAQGIISAETYLDNVNTISGNMLRSLRETKLEIVKNSEDLTQDQKMALIGSDMCADTFEGSMFNKGL